MKISRRSFIASAMAVTAGPLILPSCTHTPKKAAKAPNSLINMAFVGMGIQNRGLMNNFFYRNVKVVAVCDVDTVRREDALNRVKKFHADHPDKGACACTAYADFREVIARPDVDAVCIATPDHWHAIITLAALNAGKDVYCEKPLTHNIREAIAVMEATKRNKCVLQTGSMQRSSSEFRIACEIVRNGVIGKLTAITCQVGGPGRPCDLPEEPMEPGLDWNYWLGPAPMRPYNSVLSPRGVNDFFPNWRSYSEYGGGGVCDFGAHHFDIAQWGMNMDESGPVEVRPPEKADAMTGAVMVYANGLTVTQTDKGANVHFIGEDGEVRVSRGEFEMTLKGQTFNQGKAEKELLKDAKIRLYKSKSHTDDFLDRVADRKRPITSEIEGGHSAICCHLMHLAYTHRQIIKWNPDKLKFADASAPEVWMGAKYREPWKG